MINVTFVVPADALFPPPYTVVAEPALTVTFVVVTLPPRLLAPYIVPIVPRLTSIFDVVTSPVVLDPPYKFVILILFAELTDNNLTYVVPTPAEFPPPYTAGTVFAIFWILTSVSVVATWFPPP